MSALGEKVLIMLLTDSDSLEVLTKQGINLRIVPTEEFRPVIEWAVSYYHAGAVAPTPDAIRQRWGDLLNDREIDVAGDVEETIEWALDDLTAQYVMSQTSNFTVVLAKAVAAAPDEQRLTVLSEHAARLASLVMSLQSRLTQVDLRSVGPDMLTDYLDAVESKGLIKGMALGLTPVDTHTGGIREGELAVLAAPAKAGKSSLIDFVAYQEWKRGRVVGLWTLENSIEMTQMRIACTALTISFSALQSGTLDEADETRLSEWVHDVLVKADVPLMIFRPNEGMRSAQAIVHAARAYQVESLLIDQLTFMEEPSKTHRSRVDEISKIMRDLKILVSTGRHQMPCLLAHQINREGVKAAEKVGHLSIYHLAESCFDDRTEVMTQRGWVLFRDMQGTDEVATLQGGHRIVYQQPTHHTNSFFSGDLYTYDSAGVNFAVTPNHRLLVKNAWNCNGEFRLERVEDLKRERYAIPREVESIEDRPDGWVDIDPIHNIVIDSIRRSGRNWSEAESSYLIGAYPLVAPSMIRATLSDRTLTAIRSQVGVLGLRRDKNALKDGHLIPPPLGRVRRSDFAAFIGFWLAEGKKSREGWQVKITQSKPRGVLWVDALFSRLGWPHRRTPRTNEIEWVIRSRGLSNYLMNLIDGHELTVPAEIFSWGRTCLRQLLEGYLMGDGNWSTQWDRYESCSSVSRRLLDDIQRVILHLGMTGSIKPGVSAGKEFVSANGKTYYSNHQIWNLRINHSRRHNYVYPARMGRTRYSGQVYCVTVPNGTLLVRREGIPSWSGNSEVERTADMVFSLYASDDRVATNQMLFQILASRRFATENWDMDWNPHVGAIRVRNNVRLT